MGLGVQGLGFKVWRRYGLEDLGLRGYSPRKEIEEEEVDGALISDFWGNLYSIYLSGTVRVKGLVRVLCLKPGQV